MYFRFGGPLNTELVYIPNDSHMFLKMHDSICGLLEPPNYFFLKQYNIPVQRFTDILQYLKYYFPRYIQKKKIHFFLYIYFIIIL